MKRYILIAVSLMLVLCLASCSANMQASITADGKEYKIAFVGELYPVDHEFNNADATTISGKSYYKYPKAQFDCYISYDKDAEPNVYFESERFDTAASYYSNADNFKFFCLMGNVNDENDQRIFDIQNMDASKFDQLIEFSNDNDYNPLTAFNKEDGLEKVPISDIEDWVAKEIHFYKESKDGAFATSRGYTFVLHENRLCLLYQYDFSNDKAPMMLLRDVPTEVSDYFCDLMEKLQVN